MGRKALMDTSVTRVLPKAWGAMGGERGEREGREGEREVRRAVGCGEAWMLE